ncbi:MAG TPA: GNAT family N-acetyltransferase [Xanthobacteraceae bacterium]|jgi:GNAT superfamily N-acetyltransferase|nr:GNAT family N-acetyltransferase [Xanthobacteraceae bacterium]
MKIIIKPLAEADLTVADQIFRQSFGTFLGIPDPSNFRGDAALIVPRWHSDPEAALGAYDGETLVGSCFTTRWGSFGFLGPVSVKPDLWNQGVAKLLVEQATAMFDRWGIRQAALFTFPQSAKHIGLYQKFGFWPRYLTPVMMKPVHQPQSKTPAKRFSTLSHAERGHALSHCAELTGKIIPGLDVRNEIEAIEEQRIGETILIDDAHGLAGFAVCHIGAGSEAGGGKLYTKFGAVRLGDNAPQRFTQLLDACEVLAAETGCREFHAGINTARHDAYRLMLDRGFRTVLEGVAMLRPNDAGYNRPDCFVIDDLR